MLSSRTHSNGIRFSRREPVEDVVQVTLDVLQ